MLTKYSDTDFKFSSAYRRLGDMLLINHITLLPTPKERQRQADERTAHAFIECREWAGGYA